MIRLVTLGERELSAGPHRFRAQIVGANPRAKPGGMLGLDFVRLEQIR